MISDHNLNPLDQVNWPSGYSQLAAVPGPSSAVTEADLFAIFQHQILTWQLNFPVFLSPRRLFKSDFDVCEAGSDSSDEEMDLDEFRVSSGAQGKGKRSVPRKAKSMEAWIRDSEEPNSFEGSTRSALEGEDKDSDYRTFMKGMKQSPLQKKEVNTKTRTFIKQPKASKKKQGNSPKS